MESAIEVVIESAGSLRSDGEGPYRHGSDCVFAGTAVNATFHNTGMIPNGSRLPWDSACKSVSRRTVILDLSRPFEADTKPLGTLRATIFKIRTYYRVDGNTVYGLRDMPVGSTVKSPWTQVSVDNMNLLFAPNWQNVCGFSADAKGSTEATLSRETETDWLLELPAGSIGRLDVRERFENDFLKHTSGAVGRKLGGGLYRFNTKIHIKSIPPLIDLVEQARDFDRR